MGAPRKYFRHKSVLFVTFSLERGLLLLSNPLCQTIIKSCLSRAQHLFPVKICHFIVHANHIHLVLVVISPKDTCDFIGHFKAEVAHRLNITLGYKKRTVWCEGYDSPVVLTVLRALIAIAYLYSNPAKDNLVDTIDHFPGLSSWKMFKSGAHQKQWRFIRRPAFKPLAPDSHNLFGYSKESERLLTNDKSFHTFTIEPNAWLAAFGITGDAEQKIWNDKLTQRLRTLEERARLKRSIEKKSIIGRSPLLNQALTLDYDSKRSGRRMWCLSEKRSERVSFIRFLKTLLANARAVYKRWHVGDYSVSYPLGLFPPPQPKLAEAWFPG